MEIQSSNETKTEDSYSDDDIPELRPVRSALDQVESTIPEKILFDLPTEERSEYLPELKFASALHVLQDLLEMNYRVEVDPDAAFRNIDFDALDRNLKSDLEEHRENVEQVIDEAKSNEQRYVLLVAPEYNATPDANKDIDIKEFKERERKVLKREQVDQFREQSVQDFITEMEEPQGRGGDSVANLITDGAELYDDLSPLRELERDEIVSRLGDLIQPYLQPIPKGESTEDDEFDKSQSTLSSFNNENHGAGKKPPESPDTDDSESNQKIFDPTQTHDEHTGLRLQDIWRYLRYTWLTPYNTVPGRNINFLIRDAARPNDPVMGIATLGSPMMNFGTRDDHIGWTEHGLRKRLVRKHRVNYIERQLPKDERTPDKKTERVPQIEWLETKEEHKQRRKEIAEKTQQAIDSVILDAIRDIRIDDFINEYDDILSNFDALKREHFENPTPSDYENTISALKRLEGVARYVITSNTDENQERTDGDLTSFGDEADSSASAEDEDPAETNEQDEEQDTAERVIEEYDLHGLDLDSVTIEDENPEKLQSWEEHSETALFVRKRAEALQSLLRARYHLLQFHREHDDVTAEEFIDLSLDKKGDEELNRALRTALREIKKRRSGACMMNIMVCGAIPPYNEILGGKLVAMALTGPETIEAYKEIYGDQVSEIASGMKGEEVQKPTELVFLDTTGLFEKGSAQYDRIKLPASNGEIQYEEIGTTDGVGTIQFGSETRKWLSNVTRVDEGRRVVRGRFGEGVSPRLRKIRQGLTKCGLSGELLQHKSKRVIYAVDLAENARPYLRKESVEPDYYWKFADTETEQQSVYDYWKYRWVSKRVQKEWVLDKIREFDRDEFLLSNYFEDGYNETLF